jgi:hypothetical protein
MYINEKTLILTTIITIIYLLTFTTIELNVNIYIHHY